METNLIKVVCVVASEGHILRCGSSLMRKVWCREEDVSKFEEITDEEALSFQEDETFHSTIDEDEQPINPDKL